MTILCLPRPRDCDSRFLKTCPAARPSLSAVSAVTGSMLAVPRTPSVPKIFFGELIVLKFGSRLFARLKIRGLGQNCHQVHSGRQIRLDFERPARFLPGGELDKWLDVLGFESFQQRD